MDNQVIIYGQNEDTGVISPLPVTGFGQNLVLKIAPSTSNVEWNDILNKPTFAEVATSGEYTDLSGIPVLATVATSGEYADLLNKPSLATVATSGAYSDLSGTPVLATVATSGEYADLLNKPSLATVATSGAYSDLSGTPILATVATSGAYSDLSGTPTLATVATSGEYADLLNKPAIPDSIDDLIDVTITDPVNGETLIYQNGLWVDSAYSYNDLADAPSLATVAISGEYADLLNKPSLAAVATSGAYSDLSGTPVLATVATSGEYADLLNKPSLAAVATSGAYSDLSGTPVLATVATSGEYDDLLNKPSLAAVATSGAYSDLSGTPTLATVATSGEYADLLNKPSLAAVATSGAYSDLSGTPVLATVATSGEYADLLNKPSLAAVATSGAYTDLSGTPVLATVATSGEYADLLNKPVIPDSIDDLVDVTITDPVNGEALIYQNGLWIDAAYSYNDLADAPSLATVATSGAYSDLSGTPVLATVATSGAYSDLSGTPVLATVATSGAYADLSGTPVLATVATSGAYADLSGKPVLAAVATSGAYSDLSGVPSQNIVLDGNTLTLGSTYNPFSLANWSGYKTANLSGTITNSQLAGSITNDKLANNSVTFNGNTVALGGSAVIPIDKLGNTTISYTAIQNHSVLAYHNATSDWRQLKLQYGDLSDVNVPSGTANNNVIFFNSTTQQLEATATPNVGGILCRESNIFIGRQMTAPGVGFGGNVIILNTTSQIISTQSFGKGGFFISNVAINTSGAANATQKFRYNPNTNEIIRINDTLASATDVDAPVFAEDRNGSRLVYDPTTQIYAARGAHFFNYSAYGQLASYTVANTEKPILASSTWAAGYTQDTIYLYPTGKFSHSTTTGIISGFDADKYYKIEFLVSQNGNNINPAVSWFGRIRATNSTGTILREARISQVTDDRAPSLNCICIVTGYTDYFFGYGMTGTYTTTANPDCQFVICLTEV